ncbi:hypothetical protein ACWGPQ_22140 [Saccharomonospora azurea]
MNNLDDTPPADEPGRFDTAHANSPTWSATPIWITACLRLMPPLGRTGKTRPEADKLLTAVQMLLADARSGHGDAKVYLDRGRLAKLLGYTKVQNATWVLDYLVRIGFLRIERNYEPGRRGRHPDTFVVCDEPPASYAGPRTFAELVDAIEQDWPAGVDLFVPVAQTRPRLEPVPREPQTRVAKRRIGPSTTRSDESWELVRDLPWPAGSRPNLADATAIAVRVDEVCERFGLTRDEVRVHLEARIEGSARRRGACTARYVLGALDDDQCPIPGGADTARKDTRSVAETGQPGMSVEEADRQIRAWREKGGPGANAAARLLGKSWPSPNRDDYGSTPEQATAYYADRDQVAREWIKTNYDALLAALTNARVA